MLQSWEGFVAVEEMPSVWTLYFGLDDNGLKDKIPFGTRVLELSLVKREKKAPRPEKNEHAPTTLD